MNDEVDNSWFDKRMVLVEMIWSALGWKKRLTNPYHITVFIGFSYLKTANQPFWSQYAKTQSSYPMNR